MNTIDDPVEHQAFDTHAEIAALRDEIRRLRLRVAAAEQVATIFGWCGIADDSERGKAATQAWMDWAHEYGTPHASPEWAERIRVLAARRDETRSAVLARLQRREGVA